MTKTTFKPLQLQKGRPLFAEETADLLDAVRDHMLNTPRIVLENKYSVTANTALVPTRSLGEKYVKAWNDCDPDLYPLAGQSWSFTGWCNIVSNGTAFETIQPSFGSAPKFSAKNGSSLNGREAIAYRLGLGFYGCQALIDPNTLTGYEGGKFGRLSKSAVLIEVMRRMQKLGVNLRLYGATEASALLAYEFDALTIEGQAKKCP